MTHTQLIPDSACNVSEDKSREGKLPWVEKAVDSLSGRGMEHEFDADTF